MPLLTEAHDRLAATQARHRSAGDGHEGPSPDEGPATMLTGMKAVVQDRYGPPEVLRIEEVDRPVPKDDEVLVRVRASTVSQTDAHLRAADPVPVASRWSGSAGRAGGRSASSWPARSKPSVRT